MNKLRIDIISAVPESFDSFINASIVKKARDNDKAEIIIHNLHNYSENQWGHIDDYPFGGGAGMLIKCEPVFRIIEKLKSEREYDEIIYTAPDGELLNQSTANKLSLSKNLIILAGHYKGVDQRIRDALITKEISVGDYVLSGGELPALVITDAIVRLLPGVLGNSESALEDSFQDGLLEPPQYTRPAEYRNMKVPDILLGGNHKKIIEWQYEQAYLKTKSIRPDLLDDE